MWHIKARAARSLWPELRVLVWPGRVRAAGSQRRQEAELRASLTGLPGVRGTPGRVPHEAAVAPEGRSPGDTHSGCVGRHPQQRPWSGWKCTSGGSTL